MASPIVDASWGLNDKFLSDKFYDDTFESLTRVARENHPIFQRIQRREREVKILSKEPLNEEDDRSLFVPTLEERLKQEPWRMEKARRLYAAIQWKEKSDEIETLQKQLDKARGAMNRARRGESDEEKTAYYENSQKSFNAKLELERIKETIVKYAGCDYDYQFRSDFENFLSDIVWARLHLRESLYPDGETISELIQKYLENPLWHLPQITNFLLVDFIDSHLIVFESEGYLGLFSSELQNKIGGPGSFFIPGFWGNAGWLWLSDKAKADRAKWRFKKFLIGSGLIYLLMGTWEGQNITDLLISKVFPPWIPWIETSMWVFALAFFIFPLVGSIVDEQITKWKNPTIKNLCRQAHNLLAIRYEIHSGKYDAKTCIERLKRLEEDLHISSLIYPLLELQKRLQTLP